MRLLGLHHLSAHSRHDRTAGRGAGARRWAALAGIACVLLVPPAVAQGPYHQGVLEGLAGFDLGLRTAPAFVDLDDDGDLDLVVGTGSGQVRYLEQVGCPTSLRFEEPAANPFSAIEVVWAAVPAFGDLDADGDFDLVVGDGSGRLTYFVNTGTSSAPVFALATGTDDPFDSIPGVLGGTPRSRTSTVTV